MNNFIKSFLPLLKRLKLKKYLLEIFLLTISVIITVTALTIYIKNSRENIDQTVISNGQSEKVLSEKIFVDVSGSVKKPNIYQVDFGARIKDVIDKAGGLSDDADVLFFNRNYNLARIVNDQEKIYIPSIMEIDNGIFTQNQRTLDYVLPSEASVQEGHKIFVPLFRSINSDLNTTVALALVSLITTHYLAVKYLGIRGYLGKFFNSHKLLK